ncbi:histidine kinase [Terrimonas alba]|uniref:histidine kinase n=1 Tax=Terrimonas alba TaxID=3349636 RepID=UPI0035F3B119
MSPGKRNASSTGLFIRPFWAGLLTFVLLASVTAFLSYQRYKIVANEEREKAYNVTESVHSRLSTGLQYSLSATQAMSLLIDRKGTVHNFDSIAPLIYKAHKYIDALQLVPGGTIKYVYPMEENKEVIGYNILEDKTRNKEAYKAIEKRELFFAGPFELRQGGVGVVGRLPIFINNNFWGFSAVVIRLATLLNAAGIDTTGKSGYYFQLSKINPDTNKEEFFLPLRGFSTSQYEASVSVPDGEWRLSIVPVKGHKAFQAAMPVAILGLILSILGSIFASYAGKTPLRLKKLVDERTAELDKSEKRNKAIVNALPDMLYVIDKEGCIVDYSNPIGLQTLMSPQQFIMRNVAEVLPQPVATNIMIYVDKVLRTGQVLSYSYQLEVDGAIRSYEARFVPHQTDDVLALVRDTTEAKKVEVELIQSREDLRLLSNHLENVREEERLHIAREIHDELGQHLTVLKMNVSLLDKSIAGSDTRLSTEFNKVIDLINEMVKAVRKISHELRPNVLDQLGLVPAMEWHSRDFEKRTGLKTNFTTDFTEITLTDKKRIGLFRIFQESLTNIARHAEATRVDISLNIQEEEIIMLIEDDGKGFNTSLVEHKKTLGLVGMRERAIMMGGTYIINSSPGNGTITEVIIPTDKS